MDYPPDTASIRHEERFDEERVAGYLRSHLVELAGREIEFAQFPGGHANLTYLIRAGDLELVMRRPPLGPVAPRSHDMVREFRMLAAVGPLYPKAPRVLLLCTDEDVVGRPFFVMERRHGLVVREQWPDLFPPDDRLFRRRIGERFVDSLAELHLIDVAQAGIGDLGKPDGFVERQVGGWAKRWEAAKTREIPAMDRLAGLLAESVPVPQAATVLHNDFKLDNVMLDEAGRVVAVFDWDMATLGDPLMDLGPALAYWPEPADPPERRFSESPLYEGGFPTRAELAERYAQQTGFDLSVLGFYEAFGFFKIAVIVEQIYVRYVRGQTTDERFAEFGDRTERLAETALELAARL